MGLGLRAPLTLEKSSRERLSWHPSRPDCSSRTSLGWPGSPSRSSESGSLLTLLPLPDASSRAWATCVCSAAGAIICSGERRRSAASAAATPPVCSRGGGAAAGAMRERGLGTSILFWNLRNFVTGDNRTLLAVINSLTSDKIRDKPNNLILSYLTSGKKRGIEKNTFLRLTSSFAT